jgi:hypothetical protein
MKKLSVAVALLAAAMFAAQSANAQNEYYKHSYSENFKCVIYTAVHVQDPITSLIACKTGSYKDGYNDGWNKKPHKKMLALVTKLVQSTGCLAYESQACKTASAEDISYVKGYSDGEKDRILQDKKDSN